MELAEQLQDLHQVLFEARENALRVLAGALVPVQAVHAVRDRVLRQLGARTSHVVVVHVHHAELWLQLHGLGEERDELIKGLFSVGHLGIIHEDDAMRVLLDGCPALLVAEVTRDVPQLHVQLAKVRDAWGRIPLEIHYPKG